MNFKYSSTIIDDDDNQYSTGDLVEIKYKHVNNKLQAEELIQKGKITAIEKAISAEIIFITLDNSEKYTSSTSTISTNSLIYIKKS